MTKRFTFKTPSKLSFIWAMTADLHPKVAERIAKADEIILSAVVSIDVNQACPVGSFLQTHGRFENVLRVNH